MYLAGYNTHVYTCIYYFGRRAYKASDYQIILNKLKAVLHPEILKNRADIK